MPASTQQSTETDGAGGAAGFDGIVARISLTDGASRIDFDYNPQSVAMSRRSKAHDQANGQVAMAETGLKVAGNLMLTLTKCRFVGANLESRMVQLLNWAKGIGAVGPAGSSGTTQPSGSAVGGQLTPTAGPQTEIKLPPLTMTWGTSIRTVALESVDITFDQYSTQGIPLAATVTMILKELPPPSSNPASPDSGGVAGRGNHVMVEGDSLMSVANSAYGSSQRWQSLARANNVENPMRMPAGQQIYLPSPSEI
jgi:hypothetical protein